MDEDVRMVVGRLRCLGDAVDERDGRQEIVELELAHDRRPLAPPVGFIDLPPPRGG